MANRKVSKDEFDAFVAAYPRTLRVSLVTICEPPMRLYEDETLGDWKVNDVASVELFEIYPQGDGGPYTWAPNVYRIRERDDG